MNDVAVKRMDDIYTFEINQVLTLGKCRFSIKYKLGANSKLLAFLFLI